MRMLITGATGQVGTALLQQVPLGIEAIGLRSDELDITQPEAVEACIARLRPQAVINAAAYTAVDKAESEVSSAWAVNRDGVFNLAVAAQALGIPLFHLSTDYVFSGNAVQPYQEEDVTDPVGVYGQSKLAGEEVLFKHCSRSLVLRTSWVFSAHGNNFVKTMLRLAKDRDQLSIVADQQGGPTSAVSIANALWQLVQRYHAENTLPWGIYHFSGAPDCSWYTFAQEIFTQAKILGLLERVPELKPIATEDYPTPAKRPAWSVLDCSTLAAQLDIEVPQWQDDLREVLSHLKSHQA